LNVRHISEGRRFVAADVLCIGDISRDDLVFASKKMGSEYLAETSAKPVFPVEGIIYDQVYGRRIINLIVGFKNKTISVPFLMDSGCPMTTIGTETMIALGINANDVFKMHLNVHGFESIPFSHDPDDKKIRDLNLLGWEFFRDTKAHEDVDLEGRKVTLFKSKADMLAFYNGK
jgi:hypothetical protein